MSLARAYAEAQADEVVPLPTAIYRQYNGT
jgi:hypothetical protein